MMAEEINGHIEEQAQGYEEEGMSREDAKREAVRQMGDPVETGCALNRIHRPAFPWKLFVLAVLLTAASILMSVVISGKTEGGASQAEQLRALLVINGVSFAMIFVIMYFDYTWLFLHIRAVYALYMICLCLVWSGGLLGNYQTALLASYSVQVLLPVIFAGIIYQYRGQGFRGILKSAGWIIIPFMVLAAGLISLPKSNGAVVENAVVCLFLLVASVLRGIFGNEKKKYLVELALLVAGILGAGVAFFYKYTFLPSGYVLARLTHTGEFGYQNRMIKDAVARYSLFGNRTFLMQGTGSDGEYLLGNIFCYHSRCSCRCSICVVFDPCAASVSTTGQPDGLSVGDGVQYRVDRACDGNLYYGKFWIWRNLYSGSSVFFHKCDLSGSQRDLRRVAILRAAE